MVSGIMSSFFKKQLLFEIDKYWHRYHVLVEWQRRKHIPNSGVYLFPVIFVMSGASAMRNAVKRVTHKERAQPAARRRLGLLEKHKDYIERARDYSKKQGHIKTLKRKASERNPDEFYFEMNKSAFRDGRHKSETGKESLDFEAISHLKTQDIGYLSVRKSMDDSKVARLKENLHMIGSKPAKLHRVFVNSDEELQDFNVAEHFGTSPELMNRAFNRPKTDDISKLLNVNTNSSEDALAKSLSKKSSAYKELKQRTQRSEKLKSVLSKLSQEKNLSGKGSKKKIVVPGKDGKPDAVVFKWKRQRC